MISAIQINKYISLPRSPSSLHSHHQASIEVCIEIVFVDIIVYDVQVMLIFVIYFTDSLVIFTVALILTVTAL